MLLLLLVIAGFVRGPSRVHHPPSVWTPTTDLRIQASGAQGDREIRTGFKRKEAKKKPERGWKKWGLLSAC